MTRQNWTPEMIRLCEEETRRRGFLMFCHKDNPEDGPCARCAEKLAAIGDAA